MNTRNPNSRNQYEREKDFLNFPSSENRNPDTQVMQSNRNNNEGNNDRKVALTVDFFDSKSNPNSNYYGNDNQNYEDQNNNYDAWFQRQQNQNNNDNRHNSYALQNIQQQPTSISSAESALIQLESSNFFEFSTILKITSIILSCTFLSYISVSPRSLSLVDYNSAHKDSLLRVLTSLIWPSILLYKINGNKHDINLSVGNVLQSLSVGYVSIIAIEIIASTAMRLLVLRFVSYSLLHCFVCDYDFMYFYILIFSLLILLLLYLTFSEKILVLITITFFY